MECMEIREEIWYNKPSEQTVHMYIKQTPTDEGTEVRQETGYNKSSELAVHTEVSAGDWVHIVFSMQQ